MDKLEALASIARLSERVVRILGQNPGKFTLQGTNTYLIGKQSPYILVDTGEGRDEYVPILESALRDAHNSTELASSHPPQVSDIIISHWHRDHVDGLPSVLSLLRRLWDEKSASSSFVPPRLHKFPLPDENVVSPNDSHNSIPSIFSSLSKSLYTPPPNNADAFFHRLSDGQTLSCSGTTLRVLHTPGHTVDSVALHVEEDAALYTADTVLGQGTAVFEDLATYIYSLQKMLEFRGGSSEGDAKFAKLYPGHGPVVEDGPKLIQTYIEHRLQRENQIVDLLKKETLSIGTEETEKKSPWTTWTIVGTIYAAYPENLWLPAAHGVNLHLKKLEGEGRVRNIGGEGENTRWELVRAAL